jgi:hypothetical protein
MAVTEDELRILARLTPEELEAVVQMVRRVAHQAVIDSESTIRNIAGTTAREVINHKLTASKGRPRRKLRWWHYAIIVPVVIVGVVRLFIKVQEIMPHLKGGDKFIWAWRLNLHDLYFTNLHTNEKYWVGSGIAATMVAVMVIIGIIGYLKKRPAKAGRSGRIRAVIKVLREGGTTA